MCTKLGMLGIHFSYIFVTFSTSTTSITSSSLYIRKVNVSKMNTSSTIVKKEMEYDIPLQPLMVIPLQSRNPTWTPIQAPIIIRLDPISFNIPTNWIIEQRYRSFPKYAKRYDKVFSMLNLLCSSNSFKGLYGFEIYLKWCHLFLNFSLEYDIFKKNKTLGLTWHFFVLLFYRYVS